MGFLIWVLLIARKYLVSYVKLYHFPQPARGRDVRRGSLEELSADSSSDAFSESQLLDLCTDRTTNCRPVRVGESNALARQNPAWIAYGTHNLIPRVGA